MENGILNYKIQYMPGNNVFFLPRSSRSADKLSFITARPADQKTVRQNPWRLFKYYSSVPRTNDRSPYVPRVQKQPFLQVV